MPEVIPFATRASDTAPANQSPMPLNVRNLVYTAPNKTILKGVNLTLDSDRLTVLMGPNGAGKSIFIRLLHGLLQASSGDILWEGLRPGKAVRRQQALVFQKPVLLRRTVAGNLAFALGLRGFGHRRQKLRTALEEAGLSHLARQRARTLSGGEQQRLALARALLLKPKVLFLDEPTANLDPASTLAIEHAITKASRAGVKVIMITHDMHQARRLAGEIVFLQDGTITEHTTAETFFEAPSSEAAKAYLSGQIYL